MNPARPQLRSQLRERRAAIPAGQRLAAADAVARQLAAHPALREPGYVAGYWAMNGELPLHSVQLRLAPGQVWCLPVLQPGGRLRFAPWKPGDPLENNRYGIPEPAVGPASTLAPEALALVLLPLLGFDRAGNRLGMGGGYYDRSFAFRREAPAPPRLVGVAYACQEVATLAPEAWDVPLDALATEEEWLEFRR